MLALISIIGNSVKGYSCAGIVRLSFASAMIKAPLPSTPYVHISDISTDCIGIVEKDTKKIFNGIFHVQFINLKATFSIFLI